MKDRVRAEEHGRNVALGNFMPSGYKQEIQRAFDAWSSVADITFKQVKDKGRSIDSRKAKGQIRLGGLDIDGQNGQLGFSYYAPVNGGSRAGSVFFDTGEHWKIGFGGKGFDIFQVAAHEIGHALGLAHAAGPGALMSTQYSESFSGPQASDAAGMQALYGAPGAAAAASAGAGNGSGGTASQVAPIPVPPALPLLAGAIGLLAALRVRSRRAA